MATFLYLAIADAAVETFLSGSPLRWWIAGSLAVYLVLNLVVWRLVRRLWERWNWMAKAATSVMVLLAVLDVTAWMPDGREVGLRLLGQPTSTVLAIVTAAAIALSGIALARLALMPLAGKIVGGLLAAYGVAACLFAVQAGTAYPDLFHGASQWSKLPFWLQGATVGGLFVLPAALLLEIVTGLRILRGKLSIFGFKVTALGMSLVMVVSGMRTAADSTLATGPTGNRAGGSVAFPSTPDERGYQQATEKVNRLMAAMDVVNSKIDRSLFEIDALAEHLGSDPAVIFHFVRDQIRYEPYYGVLRGALGTLICRAGNSLDRSLLLVALLQKAGLNTQIASGELNDDAARVLVGRLFEPAQKIPSAVPSISDLLPDLSRALGTDPQKLLNAVDEVRKRGASENKKLLDYVDSETAFLSNMLAKAGSSPGVITPYDRLVAEAREHYWVRYQNPAGDWVDLDSAFAGAEPGKATAGVANTFAPDSIPEDLYHHLQVTMALRVAQVADGNDGPMADSVLIDSELRVADQQGVDISLSNLPVPMPDLTKPGANLTGALAATKGYQTILQVGSQTTAGKYFDLDGQISDKPGGPVGDVVTNARGVGGALGGLGGGIGDALGGAPPKGPASRIVGEWVDYRLTSPGPNGSSPAVHNYHRDIIAPATVKSWTVDRGAETVPTNLGKDALRQRLLWFAEVLPVTGAAVADYVGYLQVQAVTENRQQVDFLVKVGFGLTPDQASPNPPPRLPVANTLLPAGAMQIANDLTNARFAALRSYFGQPGLIAYERAGTSSSSGASLTEGYDIIAYQPKIIANPASNTERAREAAASLHITHGVLATRLEWALNAEAGAGSGANVLNTTTVFAAAQEEGVQTIILRPGPASLKQLADLSVPDPIKAEMSESLRTGHTLVLPVKVPKIGGKSQIAWWRLDDASGELIGVMPGERGQEMVEYNGVVVAVAAESLCFYSYGPNHGHGAFVTNGDVDAFEELLFCSAGTTFFLTGSLIGLGVPQIYDLLFAAFMLA